MAIDLSALWDYAHPAVSEERFRAAIVRAAPDDAFILQTQIARTWGLRKDFAKARAILEDIQPKFGAASPEAKVRWLLEMGRTWASSAHTQEQRTPEAREKAREANLRAFDIAQQSRLDNLAIDALHMMVLVDEAPDRQLEWNRKAIEYMEVSDQATAKGWAGSLYNNMGYALHQQGRYDEAITYYRRSLAAYEGQGRAANVRIAHWMIASSRRAQGRLQEALAIQQRLEREWDAAGESDPYVYEELEALHQALGHKELARHYAAKRRALLPS